MRKKYLCFVLIFLVILSAQSSQGLYQNKQLINKNNMNATNQDIIHMINQINHTILFQYLEKIVSFGIRHVGSENCRKAAEYIHEEFQNLGLDSYIDSWRYPRYKCQNVVATHHGTDLTSDIVFVLTAHLDTINVSVGANDDGSGVAALLTLARIFSRYTFNHTIKFVIVSGHEVGEYGSFDYAKKAYASNENILANINVDMIGNSTCGHIIQAFTPERSQHLYYYSDEINKKYENYIDMQMQLSAHYPVDSQSFVDYGYDAISFIQPKVFEYPFHTLEDNLEKINFPYFENVTKLILAITAELASKKIDLQVRFVTPKEGYIYLLKWPILKLPGLNLHGIRAMTYLLGRTIAKVNIITQEEILGVTYVIDGNADYSSILYEPPYEWKMQKPFYELFRLRGKHRLSVYVYTNTGKSASDEMDFFVLTSI